MANRQFSERLNKELDDIGMPTHYTERAKAFAKLIKLPRFKALNLLNGSTLPDPLVLRLLAHEFEVNEDWLLGKSDKRSEN